ncbi:hypothetical protein [Neomesorhizobium albiziae]|uniref:hypothetical protein n=1 Tax=Neomesorhizobium albiziae TaxID=335020 RepID=UPI00122C7764|nr:hypothetical protein [Mesorhizobium albiziae]
MVGPDLIYAIRGWTRNPPDFLGAAQEIGAFASNEPSEMPSIGETLCFEDFSWQRGIYQFRGASTFPTPELSLAAARKTTARRGVPVAS